jgi:transmembrane sensor
MNSSHESRSRAADEQAALWAARLDGDNLDRTQRNELDAWLAEDPAHRTLLSEYCQFSADLEEQVPALVASGSVTLPKSAESGERVRRKWTFPRVAGVTLAAAAAIAAGVAVLRPTPDVQNIAMAPAERGSRMLADGTRLEVSANTTLRFENREAERRVRLAGGEVLFAVAKDATRPFIIATPAGSVRVTGTTFNVRIDAASHTFEVTVVEGSVEVSPGELKGLDTSAPVSLRAGDQFSTRAGGLRHLSQSQIDDTLAWREGKIVFQDTPLSEVAARFAQYHGCAIHVAASVANERLGGRYGLDDLKGFLAGLELALPRVKVQTELSGAVSMSLRPGS